MTTEGKGVSFGRCKPASRSSPSGPKSEVKRRSMPWSCTRDARGVASGAAEQYRRGGVAGQLPGEVSAEKALIDQSVVDIAQALNS